MNGRPWAGSRWSAGRRGLLVAAWLLLVGFGQAAGAQAPFTLVSHGPRERAKVALTFDLCQSPGHPAGFDTALVELLEARQVPATFFAGGDWMRTHPEQIRRLAANPRFEIGNHSWSHPDLRRLSAAEIKQEVERTAAELERLTGLTTRLFRLPFGFGNQDTLQSLGKLGQAVVQWDVVTGDPDPKLTAQAMAAEVKRRSRNGSIIVMHANGRGRHTAEALPAILEVLRAKGLELATVSELLAAPAPNP